MTWPPPASPASQSTTTPVSVNYLILQAYQIRRLVGQMDTLINLGLFSRTLYFNFLTFKQIFYLKFRTFFELFTLKLGLFNLEHFTSNIYKIPNLSSFFVFLAKLEPILCSLSFLTLSK